MRLASNRILQKVVIVVGALASLVVRLDQLLFDPTTFAALRGYYVEPRRRPAIIPFAAPGMPTTEPDDASYASSSEFWNSLDWNGNVKCGKYKCLFRRRTNHRRRHDDGNATTVDADDGTAYLVGSNCRRYQFEMEMDLSYKLANYLRYEHRIKHTYLEAPRRVALTPTAAVDGIFNSGRLFRKSRGSCKRDPTYVMWNYTIVQKVRLIPDVAFVMKKNTWMNFEEYYDTVVVVDGRPSFVTTFVNDIGIAIRALASVPLLSHDFQVLVDANGNIYHIDLDRAFHAGWGGKHNDGRSHTGTGDFRDAFVADYDEGMDILHSLAAWSANRTGGGERGGDTVVRSNLTIGRGGEHVLADSLRKNTSLSCRAVNVVREMMGQEEITRDAALMMVHLVDTALSFEGRRRDDELEDGIHDFRNCSM